MGILNFFNENSLVKIRLVIYGILIILSFFIFVGVSVMKDKTTNGSCPLYFELNVDRQFFRYNGPESNCDYIIAISVIFQLVYLLLRMISLILLIIGKLSKEMILFSDLLEFIYVIIDFVAFFLTFVAACLISAGTREAFEYAYVFPFEPAAEVAQGGAWTSVVLWLIIGLIGLLVAWNSGKVPCVRGRNQDSQPKGGSNQAEMVDPSSERFGI